MLIPMETYSTCDLPGGGGETPCPPIYCCHSSNEHPFPVLTQLRSHINDKYTTRDMKPIVT